MRNARWMRFARREPEVGGSFKSQKKFPHILRAPPQQKQITQHNNEQCVGLLIINRKLQKFESFELLYFSVRINENLLLKRAVLHEVTCQQICCANSFLERRPLPACFLTLPPPRS